MTKTKKTIRKTKRTIKKKSGGNFNFVDNPNLALCLDDLTNPRYINTTINNKEKCKKILQQIYYNKNNEPCIPGNHGCEKYGFNNKTRLEEYKTNFFNENNNPCVPSKKNPKCIKYGFHNNI